MRLEGSLMLSRGDGIHFFSVPVPDSDESIEDGLYDFIKSKGLGPGELVESGYFDVGKRESIGIPGPSLWWSGWRLGYDLPDSATLQVDLDESESTVTDIRISTQDQNVFNNTPTPNPGPGGPMSYNERQTALDAMQKVSEIKKNHPAKKITEQDFAKAQADAIVDQLSDDDAYWAYRRQHDARVQKSAPGGGVPTYYADETMESKVEKLRRQEFGPETVYEVFGWALDQAADDLRDEYPTESHAQRVGRLLDEEPIAKAWGYITTSGRAQAYDDLVHQVHKSDYATQGGQALDVIDWLVGDE